MATQTIEIDGPSGLTGVTGLACVVGSNVAFATGVAAAEKSINLGVWTFQLTDAPAGEYNVKLIYGGLPIVSGRRTLTLTTATFRDDAGIDALPTNAELATALAVISTVIDTGTAQSVTSTTLVMKAAAAFATSELIGATLVIRSATLGAGQRRLITANVGSTDTLTVDAWTTTPTGTIVYDILATAPLPDIRLKKNTAFTNFTLVMFDTAGDAATGKTVTGTVSIDGAAFAALTNAVSEVGSGAYKVNLAAADVNGNDLMFKFAATGCRTQFLKVVTQI